MRDDEEIVAMCQQLHDLGFIAHYNDAKLSDWVITNPQKIIDAISAIITSAVQPPLTLWHADMLIMIQP